jgi:hypothetical protein
LSRLLALGLIAVVILTPYGRRNACLIKTRATGFDRVGPILLDYARQHSAVATRRPQLLPDKDGEMTERSDIAKLPLMMAAVARCPHTGSPAMPRTCLAHMHQALA